LAAWAVQQARLLLLMSLCPMSQGNYNWRFSPLKTPLLIHLTSSISAAKCKNFDCSLEKKISQKFCQDRSNKSVRVVSFKIVDKLERFGVEKMSRFLIAPESRIDE